MAINQLSKGRVRVGSMSVGSGGANVKSMKTGTTSLNPPSIATVTRGTVTFTLTGAAVGDVVVMTPPSGLNAGLIYVGAAVTAADTVTVYLYNTTGGAIDDGALNWTYLWFDLT